MKTQLSVFVSLLYVLNCCQAAPMMLSFQVEPQREECFYEDVEMGKEVEATVLVYRGGKLDVKLRIETPTDITIYNQLLFSNLDDKTGKPLSTIVKKGHTFVAPTTGSYKFCVDNRMSRWTAKGVTFELEQRSKNANSGNGADGTAESSVSYIKDSSNRIHQKMLLIENAQRYHFHREARHRETQDSTNARVVYWTIGESVVVLLLMAVQIFLLRFWVNKKGGSRLPGGRMFV